MSSVKVMFSIVTSDELFDEWLRPILERGETFKLTFGEPLVSPDSPLASLEAEVVVQPGPPETRCATTVEFHAKPIFTQYYKETQNAEGEGSND